MVIGKLGKEEKECVRKNRGKRERESVCVGVWVCGCVGVWVCEMHGRERVNEISKDQRAAKVQR